MPEGSPRSHTRRIFLRGLFAGGLGVGAAALAGCGNDDGEVATPPPSPETTPTREETLQPTRRATASPTPTTLSTPVTVPPPTVSDFRWHPLRSEAGPSPRRDHAVAAAGGQVFLFGGDGTDGTTDDLWAYDVTAERWEFVDLGADGPAERFGANLAYDPAGHALVLFGGQLGPDFFQDLWVFDIATSTWTEATPPGAPAARYGSDDAFDPEGRRWWVTHGFTHSGRFDDTWELDAAGGNWSNVTPEGALPIERCLMRSAWDPVRNTVLLYAGQSDRTFAEEDLWLFDVEAGAWREVATDTRPPARNRYGAYFDDASDAFIVFGGRNSETLGDTWAYEPNIEQWSPLTDGGAPSARWGHDMTLVPGVGGVLVGGHDGTSDLADVWLLA